MDLRRFTIAAACSLLAFLAVVFANPVRADWVASRGAESLRLFEKPCTNEAVLKLIPPQLRARFRAATSTIGGTRFEVCWAMESAGAYLVYEDGDQGAVPKADLKRPMEL